MSARWQHCLLPDINCDRNPAIRKYGKKTVGFPSVWVKFQLWGTEKSSGRSGHETRGHERALPSRINSSVAKMTFHICEMCLSLLSFSLSLAFPLIAPSSQNVYSPASHPALPAGLSHAQIAQSSCPPFPIVVMRLKMEILPTVMSCNCGVLYNR